MSAVVAPAVNLTALDRSTLEAHTEAREIAAALLGWEPLTYLEEVNGQPIKRVRCQNEYPRFPIYRKPGSRVHIDTRYSYVYEFDIDSVVDYQGRNCWDLHVYFAGTTTAPEPPRAIFTTPRRFMKADYELDVLKESIMPREIRAYSDLKVFEWSKTAEGQAHIALWQAGDGPAAAATNRLYACRRELERAKTAGRQLTRAYERAENGGDQEQITKITEERRACRRVRDELNAEIEALTALAASGQRGQGQEDSAPWA